MLVKLIVVSGKAQSGKDTFCDYAIHNLNEFNITNELIARKYAFADTLKYISRVMFGMSKDDLYGDNKAKNKSSGIKVADLPFSSWLSINQKEELTIREFLQFFGTDICRKMKDDCWVRACLYTVNSSNIKYAFICDARFPSEINSLIDPNMLANFPNIDPQPIFIRLTRNTLDNQHISETALDDFNWESVNTIIIDNADMTLDEKNAAVFKLLLERI